MGVTQVCFLLLLGAVGAGRLIELRVSRRNQQQMIARGANRIHEPHFIWMVAVHTGTLVGAGLEVIFLRRPFIPALALVMGLLFAVANALRWWVIHTMSGHWNAQVVSSVRLGVISHGPFRWIRHPNYVAVVVELLSLPLIHTAWLTALLATAANAWVLHTRLTVEEKVLLADPIYREKMGHKARFVPGLF